MISILVSIILSLSLAFGNIAIPVDLYNIQNAENINFSVSLNGTVATEPINFEMTGDFKEGKTIKDTYLNSKFSINTSEENLSLDLIIKDGAVYTTTESMLNIYLTNRAYIDFEKKYPELEDSTIEKVKEAMSKEYGSKYIKIVSEEEIIDELKDSGFNYEEIEKSTYADYQKTLEKYTSKIQDYLKDLVLPDSIISTTENSISFELNTENVLELSRTVVNYFDKNKEGYFNLIKDCLKELNETNPEIFTRNETNFEEVLASLEESKEYIFETIKEYTKLINAEESFEVCSKNEEIDSYCYTQKSLKEMLNSIKGSVLKGTLSVKDKTINYNNKIIINAPDLYEEGTLVDFDINASIKAVDTINEVEIIDPVEFELLEKFVNNIERKYEPYNKITINWTSISNQMEMSNPWYNEASVSMYEYHLTDKDFREQIYGATSYNRFEYHIIEDRIYLPLRAICENLGYEVSWDNENRKAYVTTHDGKTVDMTGTIVNDRTFVKIRDFEKLGYIINYEQTPAFEGFYNEATLTTPEYETYMTKVQEKLNRN